MTDNTQNEPVELLPCPSGHPHAKFRHDDEWDFHSVACAEPGCWWATGGDTKAEAIAAWNTRPAPSAAVDALREARDECLETARKLRECPNRDCTTTYEAIHWDQRAKEFDAALANTPKQSAGLVEELRRYPDWLSTLNNIVRALEDEGDRVYLGSTNDADDLREVARTLDDLSHMFALEGDRP